ncbi:MAG TPA: hypothetical protein DCZ00_03210 [Lactococcus sp.]|uniref:hypothetical protein n=1 Tax=unclassified Lactococcus TaxID=2643510 RepID=UPI000E93AEC1|nr:MULTISPECIES: hypothetical protein [unclassified Lactococcus]HAP15670.1 hypothetical protein [Lactococcus sp.]HBC90436.1 hypothetical protein [Lactococcus sp.]
MALTKEQQQTKKRIEQICELLNIDYDKWLADKQQEFITENTDKAFETSLKLKRSQGNQHNKSHNGLHHG